MSTSVIARALPRSGISNIALANRGGFVWGISTS